jgi:hypothetical protein
MAVTSGPAGKETRVTAIARSRVAPTQWGAVALVALVAVTVVAADVHPLQPVGRPRPAPAVVVAGVEVGRADEHEAMQAAVEDAATDPTMIVEREPGRDSGVTKMRAREMCAAAHAAEMAAAHATHAMSAATATAPVCATTAAPASGECG